MRRCGSSTPSTDISQPPATARRCASCCRSCVDIIEHHLRGTRFGIGVDPADGLLRQGEEGYQLTWMDAKVGDWVVTPRRGKAVEINALWYNALRLLEDWVREEDGDDEARPLREHAERVARLVQPAILVRGQGGYLYDVIDGETATIAACRPNQMFAISLTHPVLDRDALGAGARRSSSEQLLTPVGLRSLAPRPSRLQGEILRRPARARCRLSSGHRLGLADRAVHRRVAARLSGGLKARAVS